MNNLSPKGSMEGMETLFSDEESESETEESDDAKQSELSHSSSETYLSRFIPETVAHPPSSRSKISVESSRVNEHHTKAVKNSVLGSLDLSPVAHDAFHEASVNVSPEVQQKTPQVETMAHELRTKKQDEPVLKNDFQSTNGNRRRKVHSVRPLRFVYDSALVAEEAEQEAAERMAEVAAAAMAQAARGRK